MTSRSLRAQRKGVVEQKRGVQSFSRDDVLSLMDSLLPHEEEAPLALADGTPVSAAAPWQMPDDQDRGSAA